MLGCARQPPRCRVADPCRRVRPLCQTTTLLSCVLLLSLSLPSAAHVHQGGATFRPRPPACTLRRGHEGLRGHGGGLVLMRLRGGKGGSGGGGEGQMALTSHAQDLLSRAVKLAQSKGNIEGSLVDFF
ncbi:hypothetical protein T484DRAFT_1918079 [Baffinella frigidus]|nr:hypothetical protein T484DRAFT_1918079 [Cryptophyta sp. CCMP2293]